MSVTDPIADMLTRIRNAVVAGYEEVIIPASRTKTSISKILKEEGFIKDFETVEASKGKMIKIQLKYTDAQPALLGLERISKPGLRVYCGKGEIPRVYGGLGIAILSTPKGIMTGKQAWNNKLGGEVLCYVW
jgi:small subunit ribosomal protein S8